jgi:hypothetical protein
MARDGKKVHQPNMGVYVHGVLRMILGNKEMKEDYLLLLPLYIKHSSKCSSKNQVHNKSKTKIIFMQKNLQ